MERDSKTTATRSNGRQTSGQLVVKEQGRKPLFASKNTLREGKDKENDRAQPNTGRYRTSNATDNPRRSNSESFEERRGSSASLVSPGGTRIPKPKGTAFSNRKQMSMMEAMKRAEMEEGDETDHSQAMDASPSPAPRIARARRAEDEKKMRKIFSEDHLDSKAPVRPFSRNSVASAALSASPDKNESPRRRTLYGKPRAGLGSTLKEPDVGTNGVRPEGGLKDLDDKPRTGPGWLRPMGSKDSLTREGRIPALVPGIEDLPLPSIENGEQANHFENASPEKSFAWQVDQDFTAGDLQISDSPRIRMGARPFANRLNFDEGSEVDINSRTRLTNPGSRNTKLDDILTSEIKTDKNIPLEPSRPTRQPNTKLPGIAAREEEVERQIPIPDRNLPRPKNTKLPGIQQAEIEGLSKRALATTRLGEIRERNSEPRSLSPEISRPQTSRGARELKTGPEHEAKELVRPKSAFEPRGERIPDTPVTIYKSRQVERVKTTEEDREIQGGKNDLVTRPSLSHKRDGSRELLRRLGRAVSSSPQPETDSRRPPSPPKTTRALSEGSDSKSGIPRRTSDDGKKSHRNETKHHENSKPTVEFVGLPRTQSSDSVKSKRSSMHSETDPTDRIEAEMSLFAPAENHSEKGSIRAPSPEEEHEDEDKGDFDATPKPKRFDPLTMPTPKAPGAYVETPATVKVERPEVKQEGSLRDEKPTRPKSALIQDKRMDLAWRSRDKDTASDPGTDEKPATIAQSSGVRRRRTRSLPRRRGPLVNTAKLPSVKDDLMELQRSHNIEDSTLDDFEEVLKGRKAASPRLTALLKDIPTKPATDGDDDSFDLDLELDTKINTKNNTTNIKKDEKYQSDSDIGTSDRMRRMSKTLETGLLGIRTVKRGIERLEDQVSHAENKHVEMMDTLPPKLDPCAACTTHPNHTAASYIHLPMPHLYHRSPTFRITLLGMLLLLLSAWYAAESTMCAMYCRPTACSSTPCVWSINDPTFGNALPIKLDQWTTRGHGRVLMASLLEEAEDWAADIKDAYHGRDITDINILGLTFEQKRQHRRRLQKKGLLKSKTEPRDQKAKWDAWHQARVAKERAREAREMGYEVRDEEETVGGDERVWP